MHFVGYIRTNETLKAKAGFLLREIFDRFKEKALSLLKPDYTLWLYSAHDNTLINTLSALGIFDVKLCFLYSNLSHSGFWIEIFFLFSL